GSYVNGYRDLDLGHVTSRVVTGLKPGTTYHYRLSAYNSHGVLSNSAVKTATTAGGLGLDINPTFDSSITPEIEVMIDRAISIYESLFNDSITVEIRFRYANTKANGSCPLDPDVLALSQTGAASPSPSWNDFVAALQKD